MNTPFNTRVKAILFLAIALIVIGFGLFFFFKTPRGSHEHKIPDIFKMGQLDGKENIVPVVVIGSGPAGLSSALYGARSGFYTVVFEGPKPGGQLMGTSFVENWPGLPKKMGSELIKSLKEQALEFGAEFMADTIKTIDIANWPYTLTTDNGITLHALSIIVASGASAKMLGIPGEQEYFGWDKGVSTCAICDAPFYKEKSVFVVGGGDSAAEEAMQLAPYAKSITLLVRKEAMRASAVMQERLKAYDNIHIQYKSIPTEIKGDGKHMKEVVMTVDGQPKTVASDGLFLAIGHDPNSTVVKGIVAMDADGFILLKEGRQDTSVPAIFAAGDVADRRYRQAGVSSGDGIKAALDAVDFLRRIGFNDVVAKKVEERYLSVEGGPGRLALQELKTVADVEKEVKGDLPVLLDFYTDVCSTCMQMLPTLEMLAAEFAPRMKFFKVNVMKLPEVGKKYSVQGVPTFIILRKGELAARASKSMPMKEMKAFIEKALG